MQTYLVLVVIFCLAGPSALAADAIECTMKTEEKALRLLHSKIRSNALYKWTKEQCLLFMIETCEGHTAEIAVRENHTALCGGDPATIPILDRFRVDARSQKIMWYYTVDGDYINFSKVHSLGHR